MSVADRSIIEALDALLKGTSVRATIDPIVRQVEQKLAQDRTAVMAWEPIPLSAYGGALPGMIRSSWVFILRAGATTGAERHPNSHQRMMSYRGKGDLQTWAEDGWHSNLLVSEKNTDLEERWVSVLPNAWHQAVVPGQDWVVVSFHTVAAHELIEERPDATDSHLSHQRMYLAEP